MNKGLKKGLKITGVTVAVILVFMLVLPFVFKDKVITIVKKEANEMLNAKLDFESLDISLFSHFPSASIELNGLTLSGIDDFENDTLVSAESIDVAVNVMSLFSDKGFDVNYVVLDKPSIKAVKLADGRVNWDIMKPDTADVEEEKTKVQENIKEEDKPIILLVDDNEELLSMLEDLFLPIYKVYIAHDGREGLEMARQIQPDLIISDVMMPEKDGIEMTRELRADMMTSHIPIILLTAKTTIESKLEGLEYGADDYITKPFSATYLQARVQNLLIQRKKLQSFYRDSLMHINMAAVPEDLPVSAEGESREENRTEPEQEAQPAVPDMSPNDRKFMDKLVELMEQNMDNGELVVDDLVRELAVSRSVFFKKLKTLTGLAPIEFIKEIRIKRATQLIETGEFNMTQISYSGIQVE